MAIIDNHWNLSRENQKLINLLARKELQRMTEMGLAGHYDADDLEQELNLAVERQKNSYDPEKASQKTYLTRIALGTFGHIEAYLTRQKRDVRCTGSIHGDWQEGEDNVDARDAVDFTAHPDCQFFISRIPDTEDAELADWLRHIQKRYLRPEQSQLLQWVLAGGTIKELSEKTNISYQTLASRLKALEKFFRNLPETS